MEITFNAYLPAEGNEAFAKAIAEGRDLDEIKELRAVCTDEDDQKRMRRIIAHWVMEGEHSPCHFASYGFAAKIKVRRFTGCWDLNLVKTPRSQWLGREFVITVGISKYDFLSTLSANKGERIKGAKLTLHHLALRDAQSPSQ